MWAFGCVIYEMAAGNEKTAKLLPNVKLLAGRRPFEAANQGKPLIHLFNDCHAMHCFLG
jgi:hypothetical protein